MRIVSIGECMTELRAQDDDVWRLGVAGDTFNTAWYLRKLLGPGHEVAYYTCLGRDRYSARIASFMAAHGIDTSCIRQHPTRVAGLYAINLDKGERSFTYWRDNSAARCLADDIQHLTDCVAAAGMVYFSGITLAILTPDRRAALLDVLERARGTGIRVAFDPNLRPGLWEDHEAMRDWITRAAGRATVVLPSYEDEAEIFSDRSIRATLERYAAGGAAEIVVKNGGGAILALIDGELSETPVEAVPLVDSSGAGDSFNAGYLAGRLAGADGRAAVDLGKRVAAQVVQGSGALVAGTWARAVT